MLQACGDRPLLRESIEGLLKQLPLVSLRDSLKERHVEQIMNLPRRFRNFKKSDIRASSPSTSVVPFNRFQQTSVVAFFSDPNNRDVLDLFVSNLHSVVDSVIASASEPSIELMELIHSVACAISIPSVHSDVTSSCLLMEEFSMKVNSALFHSPPSSSLVSASLEASKAMVIASVQIGRAPDEAVPILQIASHNDSDDSLSGLKRRFKLKMNMKPVSGACSPVSPSESSKLISLLHKLPYLLAVPRALVLQQLEVASPFVSKAASILYSNYPWSDLLGADIASSFSKQLLEEQLTSIRLSLSAISVVQECILALARHPEALYPALHQLWPSSLSSSPTLPLPIKARSVSSSLSLASSSSSLLLSRSALTQRYATERK
jgi:hypothetical protein